MPGACRPPRGDRLHMGAAPAAVIGGQAPDIITIFSGDTPPVRSQSRTTRLSRPDRLWPNRFVSAQWPKGNLDTRIIKDPLRTVPVRARVKPANYTERILFGEGLCWNRPQQIANLRFNLVLAEVHGLEQAAIILGEGHRMRMHITGRFANHLNDVDGAAHQRLGLRQPVGGLEQLRQVVEAYGDVGVFLSVGLLVDGQRRRISGSASASRFVA